MIRPFLSSSVLVALTLGAVACTGTRHGSYDSGLAEDRSVGSLSAAELTRLCEASSDYHVRTVRDAEWLRSTCTYRVLSEGVATTPELCATAVTACVEAAQSAEPRPFDCSMLSPLPDCGATVGDFETCMSDQVDQHAEAGAGLDCSLAGSPDRWAALDGRTVESVPASCRVIMEEDACSSMVTTD